MSLDTSIDDVGGTTTADTEPVAPAAPSPSVTSAATTAPAEPAGPTLPGRIAAAGAEWAKTKLTPKALVRSLLIPLLGLLAFLGIWAALAPTVDTSLGTLPGPGEVWDAGGGLWDEYQAAKADEAAFYDAQNARNEALIAEGRGAEVQNFSYSGPPTFLDQVWTSLRTVGLGFLIASVIAVPVGLLAGLSPLFYTALNPIIQIMKPVSPLAWLPIVTLVVSATMTGQADPFLPQSFVISAIVVALCSLWPTLINTAVGASSIDNDLQNVAKVLRLGWFAKLKKLVLPSATPYIFTGMRLSLGVGWMVLIAAEMLAQNPGLGKFVWDEFQNGSSQSLSRIMFAVIVIGLIGFGLDRLMSSVQSFASRNRVA